MPTGKNTRWNRVAIAMLIAVMSMARLAVSAPTSYTIWSSSAVPATASFGDSTPNELGVKFRSDVNGSITGIRFYKGSTNTGTHVGHLWTSTGTLLGTAAFSNETASGWQQVNFTTPIAITANTVYVVSYYAPNGNYAVNRPYFTTSIDNAPLHALADGTSGPNGVYFAGGSGFPTSTYQQGNYWVDVVFTPAVTTSSIWSSSTVPATPASADANHYELGLKFRSDVNGTITGVKFYKGSTNTGTHVGRLWTSTGQLLASATFTNETASGWQQVTFGTPVAITANTTYIASYSDPNGHYAVNDKYFAVQYDKAPLHALQHTSTSPNGVYSTTPGSFPSSDSYNENYWVDVVFSSSSSSSGSGSTSTMAVSSLSPASGSTTGGTAVTITGNNFQNGATVNFGGTISTAVTVISATQINVLTPSRSAGTVGVTVTNSTGTSATLSNAFTYSATPAISSISPASGPATGGTTVTILGSGFQSGAIVSFGAMLATSATVIGSTQIQAVTPAEPAGVVSITVKNPDQTTGTLSSAFTFLGGASAPTISSISPNSNVATGGVTATLTGTNFQSGATVKFGSTSSSLVSFVNSTTLRAVVPPGTAQTTVSVTVTNPDNQSGALANGFRYGSIIFSDNFEQGNFSKWDQVWTGTDVTINTSIAHSGSYSARMHYALSADANATNRDNNRFLEKGVPNLSHFFVRGYLYMQQPSAGSDPSVQRKLIYCHSDSNNNWGVIPDTFYNLPSYSVVIFNNHTGTPPYPIKGVLYFNYNQWYSIETEVQANTPGQADGFVKTWVNGNLVGAAYNLNIRDTFTSGINTIDFGAQVNSTSTGAVDEYRYWDDVVVADAYVGP